MLIGFLLINRRDMQQTAKTILDNFAKFANYVFRIVLRIMFFINLIATVELMTFKWTSDIIVENFKETEAATGRAL